MTATLTEAMTKMLVNDFSQLPVLKSPRSLEGAVTWRSIARTRMKDPDAPLSAAIVPATTLPFDHDLHTVLPTLRTEDFVVVRNHHNEITGIVTTADVVGLFEKRTVPFLPVGELDQELRRIMTNVDFDLICKVCGDPDGPDLASPNDMTMGQYQRVLENPDCWAELGWPLDRKVFVERTGELRHLRNDITPLQQPRRHTR